MMNADLQKTISASRRFGSPALYTRIGPATSYRFNNSH